MNRNLLSVPVSKTNVFACFILARLIIFMIERIECHSFHYFLLLKFVLFYFRHPMHLRIYCFLISRSLVRSIDFILFLLTFEYFVCSISLRYYAATDCMLFYINKMTLYGKKFIYRAPLMILQLLIMYAQMYVIQIERYVQKAIFLHLCCH